MNNMPPSGKHPLKKVISRPVVKVQLPAPDSNNAAIIYSQDGKVQMETAVGMVSKRLHPGERVAYFKSDLDEDGILELGDRVPTPDPAW